MVGGWVLWCGGWYGCLMVITMIINRNNGNNNNNIIIIILIIIIVITTSDFSTPVHVGSVRQTATILHMSSEHLRTGDKAQVGGVLGGCFLGVLWGFIRLSLEI